MILVRPGRVLGLCHRYFYIYTRSGFRLLDVVFWPVMDLIVWGFVAKYFMRLDSANPTAITFLIGAIIFFNILNRAQQSISVSFLEDLWSRNLLNAFVAPITVAEFVASTFVVGLTQIFAVSLIMSGLAFCLYAFNILTISFALIPLFLNLLFMGWSLGMFTTSLIFRFGHQAEALAWAVPFLIQPISAVFYPVSVLPDWLQPVAYMVPATYVFEGMRAVLSGHGDITNYLITASGLNVFYFIAISIFFGAMLNSARERGALAKLVV
ncbi:MAG: ABC transporter permease [Candidatus Obscuribacterales bacterium]